MKNFGKIDNYALESVTKNIIEEVNCIVSILDALTNFKCLQCHLRNLKSKVASQKVRHHLRAVAAVAAVPAVEEASVALTVSLSACCDLKSAVSKVV